MNEPNILHDLFLVLGPILTLLVPMFIGVKVLQTKLQALKDTQNEIKADLKGHIKESAEYREEQGVIGAEVRSAHKRIDNIDGRNRSDRYSK